MSVDDLKDGMKVRWRRYRFGRGFGGYQREDVSSGEGTLVMRSNQWGIEGRTDWPWFFSNLWSERDQRFRWEEFCLEITPIDN